MATRKMQRMLKPSRDPRGYSEDEVKGLLFDVFTEWMRGQTVCALSDDSGTAYYNSDVARFVGAVRRSALLTPTLD